MSQSTFILSADGTRIFANAVGDPSKPALVFVHGFSADSSIFDNIFNNPLNSQQFFLVRYDTRGAGRAGKPSTPEDYTSDKYAQDFAAVGDAFRLTKPVLVGWSMGALVINDVVSHLPPCTLAGAVGIAGTPYVDPSTLSAFESIMMPIRMALFGPDPVAAERANIALSRLILLRNASPSAEFLAETTRAVEQRSDFSDDNPSVSWEARCNLLGTSALMSSTHRRLIGTRAQDNTKLLEVAKQGFPLLLILGVCDPSIHGEGLTNALRQSFTNITVETLANGCHAPFLDEPHEVMQWLVGFSKQL